MFKIILFFLKNIHSLFMIVSQFSYSFFIFFNGIIQFTISTSSLIETTSFNTLFFSIIESLEFMKLLLRCFIMLTNEIINFSLFFVNLTFKLLFTCSEFIFVSLRCSHVSCFHFFDLLQSSLLNIICFIQIFSKALIFLLSITIFKFMFKLELIELLFHLFKIISESSSCIIMLLLKHFSFLNKLVFHIIYSLLEFFSSNDRLSILGL